MKIDKMLSESGNDFTAMLICEHCNNKQEVKTGYHDNYYHTKVMPAITCKVCGMNRAGEVTEKSTDNGRGHV